MRQRSIILRIIVVVFLIYSFTAFGSGLKDLRQGEIQTQELEDDLERLREQNILLKTELAAAPDENSMRKLAREKLGMLRPEDKIFIFSEEKEK